MATYAIVYGIIVFVLLRYGVLALVVTIFVTDLVPELIFTTNFSAWYGAGSLLDQSLILYGGGMGDGNLHRHSNLPCLTAGKLGGQFETGRHLAYKLDTPMSNLLVSILNKAGAPTERVGDSTGPLEV